MADKRKPAEKPSKNRTNASHKQDKGGESELGLNHVSGNAAVEGGQNQDAGEPHYGYGSDQGQSQGGKKQGTTN